MTAVPSDVFMAHRASLSLLAIYSLAFFLPIAALADSGEYFYDDQRRLTSVSDSTGTTAVCNYDAVGNFLSLDRLTLPGSGIGIYLANPVAGPVTQLCRLQGYGIDRGADRKEAGSRG